MIALKTSPLLFGHEILLVFHLFLLFGINSITYDLYTAQFSERYYISSIPFVIALPLSIVHGKRTGI